MLKVCSKKKAAKLHLRNYLKNERLIMEKLHSPFFIKLIKTDKDP